jgi:Ca2+-transporting ATPase
VSASPEPDLNGLTTTEAEARLRQYGENLIEKRSSRGLLAIATETLREPMFLLLIGAAALYLVLGDLGEGLFLTAGALLSIALVIFQESRSERALAALRELAEPMARVVRDGRDATLSARRIVPGDLMLVGEGERLPADGRLLSGGVLSVDESVLTGESAAVTKQSNRPNASAILAGTLIVAGQGAAVVTATGSATALGKIGASLAQINNEPTPLQRSAGRIVRLLGLVALAFCAVVGVAYGVALQDWTEGVLAGITVAIALIPEEFPMVLEEFMALGAWRLARHRVLVRRGAVIEALGSASILCVDKTGTLTENRMQVAQVWPSGAAQPASAADPSAGPVLRIAADACATRPVDPMDRAVRNLAGEAEGEPHRTWPLQEKRLAVIQLWSTAQDWRLAAKGAPEAIGRLCRLSGADAEALQEHVGVLAARGLRVLGVASSSGQGGAPDDPDLATFDFAGLLAFVDPLRADVPAALAEARAAGIEVAMITGDYPATALEIARQAGLDVRPGALTGAELEALTDEELSIRVRTARVFARVRPEQKLRLVEAFRRAGQVVAMTGDGVNDAPALKAAHIGIAMGKRGTDVAREASDLVLLDDSFASIVGGVRLGRRIFDNLRKALTYITAIHVPIAGLALLPILFGLPPMLMPMHVVLLELVIDPICSLGFEAEPSDPKAMQRPPRRPSEPLFGLRQLVVALLQGLVVLVTVFLVYLLAVRTLDAPSARGAALLALIAANFSLALADTTSGSGLFGRGRYVFWSIIGVAALAVALIFNLPVLEDIFDIRWPGVAGPIALGVGLLAGGGGGAFLRRLAAPGAGRGTTKAV